MAIAIYQNCKYVLEEEESFLKLWPHRYDYIYSPHLDVGDRPQWQTESRYPLSDRLIQQGAYLYGVRFNAQTQYCLLDIDASSAYHPQQDALALNRITAALESLGLVSYLVCTSSYSGGLHLYFPFEQAQNSWQLAIAVTTLLENHGFKCQPGQLEVFPNPKLYVTDGAPNLFNAHRLPLQIGSYLLNSQLEPIHSSHQIFTQQWQQCQQHNAIETEILERVIKQTRRRPHRISGRADKFLNDLNAEIELGWTGNGQTNYLLGRITMRTYIFHHVLHGGLPLNGDDLINEIIAIATALPGYCDWCGHQHEIYQRAAEWARCIENSRYFPYGSQHGKYKASKVVASSEVVEVTWNMQRSQTAQDKIRAAVETLFNSDRLPVTTTARFKKLLEYGIGGSTLYKYKSLWHPNLWKSPQAPQPSNEQEASALASPAIASYATSLLPSDDGNPAQGKGLEPSKETAKGVEARNQDAPTRWGKLVLDLKERRAEQNRQACAQHEAYQQSKAQQNHQKYRERMLAYLKSGDPILIQAGFQGLARQQV